MPSAKVLVVEDESIVALDIRNRLTRMGYRVVGMAVTGQEAIDQVRERRPNLVLMDIRLKGEMDGIEAAGQIRAHFAIPVIYLTAYADENTLQRAKITEPYGYLIKPFEERDLSNIIEIALYKHQVERQLRDQARQLQLIVNTVPQGMILLDPDCHIVMANPQAWEYLAGLTDLHGSHKLSRLGNRRIEELLAPPSLGLWYEINLTKPSPRVFEVVANSVHEDAILEDFGNTGWVLLIRDVTQSRIIQQRAQEQERMAAVGQLAAGIAHDFKNILTAIVLSAQAIMMRGKHLLPQEQEQLARIYQQAMRANDLIRQILDFSRSSVMERHSIDIVPLLEESLGILGRTLPENISLQSHYEPGKYVVNGDATRITQVLMNLTLNARDAMPTGGILCIGLKRVSGSVVQSVLPVEKQGMGEWIQISVSDTGTGIPTGILDHIFEPFFTTKAPGKGTGLGLAQVYGIVQQHEGYIDVKSQVGAGTVFTIYLPAEVLETENKENSFAPDGTCAAEGRGECLMIVEDSVELRAAMCDVMEMLNYQVIQAGNGSEALDLFNRTETPVDLVISDLAMPVMDGIELCAELRRLGNDVKIIVMTGYSSEGTAKKLRSLGIIDCIQKPPDMNALSERIAQLLRTRVIPKSPVDM